MAVTYYIKLFRTGADRHNDILMSVLLLVAETTSYVAPLEFTFANLFEFVFHNSE